MCSFSPNLGIVIVDHILTSPAKLVLILLHPRTLGSYCLLPSFQMKTTHHCSLINIRNIVLGVARFENRCFRKYLSDCFRYGKQKRGRVTADPAPFNIIGRGFP